MVVCPPSLRSCDYLGRMIKADLRRVEIGSRVVAAALGGYALSAATAACLALVLPMARSEAVLTGTMVSFVVYVCAVLWVFAASSARRAWLGLVVPVVVLGGTVLILRLDGA